MSSPHDELLRIDLEIRRTRLALEDLDVDVGDAPARVGDRDSLRVARLKERLTVLRRDRARALAAADRVLVPAPDRSRGNLH
jgi:hypothetical protein